MPDAFKRHIDKYRMRQPPAERMLSGMKVSEGKIISMRGCFIFRVDWSETLAQQLKRYMASLNTNGVF